MYYIYHIPEVKIGCTCQLEKRMKRQGFTEWEILEVHEDVAIASKRELELQQQYGYSVDHVPYNKVLNISNTESCQKGSRAQKQSNKFFEVCSKGSKSRRRLTFEQAQEIRRRHTGKRGQIQILAKEYNMTARSIWRIINNLAYLEP